MKRGICRIRVFPQTLATAIALVLSTASANSQPFVLDQIAASLGSITEVTHSGDDSGRLFVSTQTGQIRIHNGVQLLPAPFLDISTRVSCCGERGLLGLAFHPDYETNGFFYVNYTDVGGNTQVSRFSVSSDNRNVADDDSEQPILVIAQPFPNHNGGAMHFGPDGFLYIATGDGGLGGDPGNRAQDVTTLLGKLLRIDVNGSLPYQIPAGNPFVGITGLDEIWAYGLRNPWRFSFDRVTGDMFIGDVGQSDWEEIDFQPAASTGCENYGWRLMEGNHCFDPPQNCQPGLPTACNPDGEITLPIYEYANAGANCSVTGGYRYRGQAIPELQGIYLFSDACSGRIWGALLHADGSVAVAEIVDTPESINTFGEDEQGELYVGSFGGNLFRITPSLRISPPTGAYGSTQSFDVLISIYEPGTLLGLSVRLDGTEIFEGFPPCAVVGSLPNGGTTLRCPLAANTIPPGNRVLAVTVEMASGSVFDRSVTWTLEPIVE